MRSLTFFVSLIFFLVSVAWLYTALQLPFSTRVTTIGGPATVPCLLLSCMCFFSFIVVIKEFHIARTSRQTETGVQRADALRLAGMLAGAVIYVNVIEVMGYLAATAALILLALILFGQRKKAVLILVPLLFPAVIYIIFQMLLNVQLP